jgi:hypothetical protein
MLCSFVLIQKNQKIKADEKMPEAPDAPREKSNSPRQVIVHSENGSPAAGAQTRFFLSRYAPCASGRHFFEGRFSIGVGAAGLRSVICRFCRATNED